MDIAASSIWSAIWAAVWVFMAAKQHLTKVNQKKLVGLSKEEENVVYETQRGTKEWEKVVCHGRALIKKKELRELALDKKRSNELRLEGPCGLVLDWSRHQVTSETMRLLGDWAKARGLEEFLNDWSSGKIVNPSESRAALHQRLRAPAGETPSEVSAVRDIILRFAEDVRSGRYSTALNSRFESVIIVGIGGSRLGPEVAVRALQLNSDSSNLQIRFLSALDGFHDVVQGLNPHTTLVVISSKSFTTIETTANAARVRNWLATSGLDQDGIRRHTVACTAQINFQSDAYAAVFRFWDTVGGRYSVTGSPGLLPLALACGADAASRFLAGSRQMDLHLFNNEEQNLGEKRLPVVMALLAVYNARILGLRSGRCIVPYSSRLALLPAHLQQLEMESLGKPGGLDSTIQHILFGAPGTDAQHSFFQLLHQSPIPLPTDFIGCLRPPTDEIDDWVQWDIMLANLLAQPDALALGVTNSKLDFYFPGGRPSLTIMLPALDPTTLGALMTLYEHRTVILGYLLSINPFDQPGVELGKRLANTLSRYLSTGTFDEFPSPPQTSAPTLEDLSQSWTPATSWMLKRYNSIRPSMLRQTSQIPLHSTPATDSEK
uniref:Glucose-6-phosphate isomerase n=1 Tax=Aureoumbra lagunensis TaxID=44058 RepID=A0A7S3NIN5_9STRA|mmetsp:Transcript_14160/g.21418  ORF Transcript_14160/g.21418 Transcript_14160/m.21418 type:complete len:605 (-) Transcript_14160:445-2259(-)|eukprot:CAMPEP_0197320476 /NCGR_PEP_ID=MMETSP0891-20130614/60145_1 /TAXON_ID=44058 ORGANISM="Aureoumbra lagunensis, Strain CCMP1510" /NCGR_SAMPLE_ID=MMETSP0891 /ASSEMBLY_ACC=CAM_ASM_000534 /LENGTH=604 /DNA_ID=CAMNT_0042811897 /DNA_START=107 /DNA_END=1924 /DNA_ORIENTATION=-